MKLMILLLTASSSWSDAGQDVNVAGDAVNELVACGSVEEDRKRLACFDRLMPVLTEAQRRGDLLLVDRKAVIERRERAFGLPAANSLAVKDVRGADVTELTGVVRQSFPTRTPERYRFVLQDGSTWEMLEPFSPPRAGEKVVITAARLGGFRARIGSRRAVSVKRTR